MQAVQLCIADIGRGDGDAAAARSKALHGVDRGLQHQAVGAPMHDDDAIQPHDLHHLAIGVERGLGGSVGTIGIQRKAVVRTEDVDV